MAFESLSVVLCYLFLDECDDMYRICNTEAIVYIWNIYIDITDTLNGRTWEILLFGVEV